MRGEPLHARHSIACSDLESWYYAFSVWAGDRCPDWDATVRFTRRLGVPVPPVLWRGTFDPRALRRLRLDLSRQEGYVVRTVAGFTRAEFPYRVAKWVRRDHVRTDVLGEAPLEPLRAGLRSALAGLDRDAADRCWAEARSAHAQGRIGTDGVARKLLRRLGGLGLAPAGRAGPAVGGWDRHHRGRGCAGHRCGR
ncbi:RNA ligase family protein [Micromonospora sp. HM5-17]|uniref:RNA ligase family protein n=1 Tax=Micromonospora sp. HM5-17 TaxID=2487710 RepID=UPI0018F4C536|nr:RNA ligase family protein [Micromonospora sp. HM5-17]